MSVPPRGSVTIVNVPLENVIVNTYGIPAFRVLDAPEWIKRERFDISAKMPDEAAPEPLLMLRSLLEERFKLRVRRRRLSRDLGPDPSSRCPPRGAPPL